MAGRRRLGRRHGVAGFAAVTGGLALGYRGTLLEVFGLALGVLARLGLWVLAAIVFGWELHLRCPARAGRPF